MRRRLRLRSHDTASNLVVGVELSTWRIYESIRELIHCNDRGLTCRSWQFQEPTDRRRWDHTVESIWTAAPRKLRTRFSLSFMLRLKNYASSSVLPEFGVVGDVNPRVQRRKNNTFDTVSAGDHCERRMSKQMEPFELMFGW